MKKLLIASTALVLSAGVAQAQVSFAGTSRFGIEHNSGAATQTTLSTRTRLNVTMSGTTDGGLSFGAFTRFQTTNTATGVASGSRVFISANGFRLEAGNIDGAVARRVGLYNGNFGAGGFGYTGFFGAVPATHAGFTEFSSNGVGPNAIRVDADFGAFGVSLSGETAAGGRNELGLSYSASGISAGLGVRDLAVGTSTALSAQWTGGGFTVGLVGTNNPNGVAGTNARLYGAYTMGANTFSLALSSVGSPAPTQNAVAVGYSHNLGGGAILRAALGRDTAGNTRAEVGMNLSF